VTILNPEHLFDQAQKLVAPPPAGPPRQVDLRRAISSAYYGLFHFTLASVANEFVGFSLRGTSRYALVYRSVDHRTLKETCIEARKRLPAAKYAAFVPVRGFGSDIQAFAEYAVDLQEKRHKADYDPLPRFKTSDAALAIQVARNAVRRFRQAEDEPRKAFLTLLLCPPR
jgi:hypothetical protein